MDNETHWLDNLSLMFSVLVAGWAAWLIRSGLLMQASCTRQSDLVPDPGLRHHGLHSDHAVGNLGLALSSSAVKNWSPGPLTMVIHATISWLGLLSAWFTVCC